MFYPFFGGFLQWVAKLAQDLDTNLEGVGKTVPGVSISKNEMTDVPTTGCEALQ